MYIVCVKRERVWVWVGVGGEGVIHTLSLYIYRQTTTVVRARTGVPPPEEVVDAAVDDGADPGQRLHQRHLPRLFIYICVCERVCVCVCKRECVCKSVRVFVIDLVYMCVGGGFGVYVCG